MSLRAHGSRVLTAMDEAIVIAAIVIAAIVITAISAFG
jgi:hypothetical protein